MIDPEEPSATQAEGSTLRPVSRSEEGGREGVGRVSAMETDDTPKPLERADRRRGRHTPWFGGEWCKAKDQDICLQRQGQMELCPVECGCGNSLYDLESKTERITTELGAGLRATKPLRTGEVVAVFGDGLTITDGEQVRLIKNLINEYRGAVGTGFQYSVICKIPGESNEAIIMPEEDRMLAVAQTNGTPNSSKAKCKRILARSNVIERKHGVGQFSNHTCCTTHLNTKLWLVSVARANEDTKSDKDGADTIAILRAITDIQSGQEILTSYRQTNSGHKREVLERQRATLAKMFECSCCKCKGRCRLPADHEDNRMDTAAEDTAGAPPSPKLAARTSVIYTKKHRPRPSVKRKAEETKEAPLPRKREKNMARNPGAAPGGPEDNTPATPLGDRMKGNPGRTENDTRTVQTTKLNMTTSGPGRPTATKIKNNNLKTKQRAQNAATGARLLKWLTAAKPNAATSDDRGTAGPIKGWPQVGTSDLRELSRTEPRQTSPRMTTPTDDKDPREFPEPPTMEEEKQQNPQPDESTVKPAGHPEESDAGPPDEPDRDANRVYARPAKGGRTVAGYDQGSSEDDDLDLDALEARAGHTSTVTRPGRTGTLDEPDEWARRDVNSAQQLKNHAQEDPANRETETNPAAAKPRPTYTATDTERSKNETELDFSDPELDWNALERGVATKECVYPQPSVTKVKEQVRGGGAEQTTIKAGTDLGIVKRLAAKDTGLAVTGHGDRNTQKSTNRTTRRLELKNKFPDHPLNDWIKANQPPNPPAPSAADRVQAASAEYAPDKGRQPTTTQDGGHKRAASRQAARAPKHLKRALPDGKTDAGQREATRTKVANGGNTCYISAVLFYLFATPSSRDRWLDTTNQESEAAEKNKLRSTIWNDFVDPIRAPEGDRHIDGEAMRRIRTECCRLNWLGGEMSGTQQDPEEFFNWLHQCLGGRRIAMTSNMLNEAGVKEANPSNELFSSLSLPLWHPHNGKVYPDSTRDLRNLLKKFMCENSVDRGEKQGTTVFTFSEQPDIIDFHLKRYDFQSGRAVKTMAEVKFPMTLSLDQHGVEGDVHWELKAVVSHLGTSVQKGHCVAISRTGNLGKKAWTRLDDGQNPSLMLQDSPCTAESLNNGLLLS